MRTIDVTDRCLRLRFTGRERLTGFVRDQDIPLTAVRSAAVVREGLAEVHGLRSPGLSWPGHTKIGTYRGAGARLLVCVRRGVPALSVQLADQPYTGLIVSTPGAVVLARRLASAGAGLRCLERELAFDAAGTTLRGTLTIPATAVGPSPAVLLLVGSGPLDRDSNHRRLRLGVTRQLAESLAAAGIASLRYDKRGVGASGGGDWRQAGFWGGVADARAALTSLSGQPEVDAGRIMVVGHSEGALVATALAGRGAPVQGVVLLAGSGVPGRDVLEWQARRIPPTLPASVRRLLRLLRVDPVAKALANQERVRAAPTPVARIGGVRINTGWMQEFMDYDPVDDLGRVTVPLLAITGEKDIQVNPDDLSIIQDTAPGAVTIRMPDLTHTLRRQCGAPTVGSYRHEVRRPVDPGLSEQVVGWLRRLA